MDKKFSGILLVTDFDGTLSCGGVCEENVKAIDYFIEGGGVFTLATGRGGAEITDDVRAVRTNAPIITMIGAQVYDTENDTAIESYYLDSGAADIVRKISEEIGDIRLIKVYFGKTDHYFTDADPDEFEKGLAQINSLTYKIVIWLTRDFTPDEMKKAEEIGGGKYNVCSNGADYFEITALGVNKGAAVLRMKEKLGARLLVCAGDSNGDISMVEAADIGYAAGNAIDELKKAADRVTVHAKDGAIAQIIKDIEREIEQK
ncbi:MAG: HAD-IIB family hydrolase [Ruminococcaceae bacterium]|nr:HAD-IIB family hydrolase [Oscillospiraceae bacterium]